MLFLPTEGTHNRVRLLIKGREPERGLSCFMTMCANPTNRHEELQARTGQKLRAALVTNPNIHYLLTCSPDRNDCELLLAGERYEFTPAPERVYPTGPNLATHGDGRRIVVLVQRTNTF